MVEFKDLPSGLPKGTRHNTKSFTAAETEWWINWFPAGDENAKNEYCSIYLVQKKIRFQRVHCNFTLKVDNRMKEELLVHTFDGVNSRMGVRNFMKTDAPFNNIILSVEIGIVGLPRWNLFRDVISKMERDIRVDIGEISILANSSILSSSSPVFQAMLNSDNGYVESREKSIKLEDVNEEHFKELVEFLHAGKPIELDIKEPVELKKLMSLISLGEKYQVNSLLEHLLFMVADTPSNEDVLNRLKVLSHFERIPSFCRSGAALMTWVSKNLSKTEICEIMSKFLFHKELPKVN